MKLDEIQMSKFAKTIMEHKYSHELVGSMAQKAGVEDGHKERWHNIAYRVTKHVMKSVGITMRDKLAQDICKMISDRKFMPGGRYLYASGRSYHQTQNCVLLKVHDSREGWAELLHKASMALMTGAGIGVDYSGIRHEGSKIRRTGGVATGPIALAQMLNECGRGIMQGGSRRCLPGDAPVIMHDGTRKCIKDIHVGDIVFTRHGPRKVTNTFQQGKQSVVKITTKYGECFSSKEHRWLGATTMKIPKWLKTKNLKPGWSLYFCSQPTPRGTPLDQPAGKCVKSEILDIEEIGEHDTYDIEVEDVHEFVAYNHVSHNSAIWAGLRWDHPDVHKFIRVKNWSDDVKRLKEEDFNFPATLDCTNISVILNDEFFEAYHDDEHPKYSLAHSVYWAVVEQMLETAEPGLSIDTGKNSGETLRNACTEITSRDDSDICNLGSLNLANIESIEEFESCVNLATAFLLAGTVYSDVPYSEIDRVRGKNRRLGLGLMGVHEWLLQRGRPYGPDDELEQWLRQYKKSTKIAHRWADEWELSRPKKTRAIAPTGTISIVAETTGGLEPIFCVAYKRRYLKHDEWCYQYVVDPTAKRIINQYGVKPESIEDAYRLAENVERRVSFQAWIQQFVDHAISSTINLPHWGSESNNSDTVRPFGSMLMRYLPNLRGITCYPDGCRGGQPLVPCSYSEAIEHEGVELVEEPTLVCEIAKGGDCGE